MSAPPSTDADMAARLPAAIELRNVTKRFPGVRALDDVSIDLRRGEVHALLGENGAGKSTLIKILTGSYFADEGTLCIDGEEVRLADPHDAQRRGIALVPQDVLVVPELSIGRNILMGRESLLVSKSALSEEEQRLVQDVLSQVGADYGPNVRAGRLSIPQLRLAQIARALAIDCSVLVLDEPTAALNEHDAENLLERVKAARSNGKAVVFVTHRLSEVMLLADRVSVLRNGRKVGSFSRGEFTRESLVDLLTKTKAGPNLHIGPQPGLGCPSHSVRLEASGISDGDRLHDVDLQVRPNQIVGVAGVQGSGHGQLVKVLAGLAPASGRVAVDGKTMPLGRPPVAFNRGIILVPADRRNAAIVGALSIQDNLVLSRRIRPRARRFGLRWSRRERQLANEYIRRLSIKAPSTRTSVGVLSGGNQQKVALSRALEGNAHVLLVEEPTQGIDIDAKTEVRQLLREFAAAGGAVVVATSEFEELIDLADEAVVLNEGRVSGRLARGDITYRNILSLALS